MLKLTDQLLLISRSYARAKNTKMRNGANSLGGISTQIFHDGKTLARIANGGDLSTGNFEKALRWFSDNWPEGTAWPEGIPRPAPSSEAAA